LRFVIDNTYFKCGDLVFKQNIGIPMGTDCAPKLANLFLFYHEFKFMNRNLRNNSTRYFESESESFLDEVIRKLHEVIKNPNYASSFTVYFNSNEVTYNDHSSYVGGDILNSFVNPSGVANGVHSSWSL
ncbi:MAG: hypothetical protein AAF223_20355, partial [Bacteroidota bacterium]